MDWNLATVWESVSDAVPDRTAIVQGDRRLAWREFDDRAARLAAAFATLGLGPDSKVAFYLYNSTEYLEGSFAAFKARSVPVNVNYRYTEDELLYMLDNSDAELLLFHGALGPQVAAAATRAPKLRAIVQVDDGAPLVEGALRYDDLLAEHAPMERIDRSGNDLWFLYTGGTTGRPKGVMWRHEDLFGVLLETVYQLYGESMPERAEDAGPVAARIAESGRTPVHLPASPLMHGTGAMTTIQTFSIGGTVVTLENRHFDADELWRVVQRERVSQMAIVGDAFCKPMVAALDEAQERGEPYDIASLGLVVSSGVMWTGPVKAALQAHQPVVCLDSLGSSEGVGFANQVTTPGGDSPTARFKIGAGAKVFTEHGEEVEPGSGEMGLIAVGGFIPLGYYKDEAKSAETFREIAGRRWSVPGDWATVETDGTITLLGRGSACINSAGEKVYPEEVEEALKTHPAVADCNVVGVPDERFGEAVTALVSLEPGTTLSREALVEEATVGLARYKHPRHVIVVDEVPRGANGKADYKWAKRVAQQAVDAGEA